MRIGKKSLFFTAAAFLILAAFAATISSPALARNDGKGGTIMGIKADQETTTAMSALGEKYRAKADELRALFAAPSLEEAKAVALQKELNAINDEMAMKRLSFLISHKKNNPSWKPRPGGNGDGEGRGDGSGRGRGRGDDD